MAGPETPYPTGALNKWDILPRFGDRVLMAAQEPVRMESLDLQANLMQRPLVTDDLAAQYNAIAPENGVVGERESVRLKPISVQLISRDPKTPISLVVYKHMKLDDDQQWYDRVEAGVLRGDLTRETDENIVAQLRPRENHIGDFVFQNRGDHFDLHHRIVRPEYRGPQNETRESVGNILLTACEQAAAKFTEADPRTNPKFIGTDTAKLDVMVWLYNNGYRPKTARDLERFDRVLSGDTDLYVIDGLFICEGLTEDEKKPGATIDYDKIFRINFEKPIAPAQPVVTAIDPDAREAERRAQLKDWETARLLREALKKEGHKGI